MNIMHTYIIITHTSSLSHTAGLSFSAYHHVAHSPAHIWGSWWLWSTFESEEMEPSVAPFHTAAVTQEWPSLFVCCIISCRATGIMWLPSLIILNRNVTSNMIPVNWVFNLRVFLFYWLIECKSRLLTWKIAPPGVTIHLKPPTDKMYSYALLPHF